jgi:hypothetical protein
MVKNMVEQKQLKVVEVLSASDLNPKYLNCVELYITSWLSIPIKKEVKFLPRVVIVANYIPDSLREYSEYLRLLNPQDMPTAFVAQTSRIVEARNSTADFVMTSDIDMLPLNVDFESKILDSEKLDLDSFFILRDVLEPGQFPICYNLAKPKVWNSLLNRYGGEVPTQNILRGILDKFGGNSVYSGLHGGKGWTIDQQLLWSLVQDNVLKIQFERFADSQSGHRRLDRIHHRGLVKWLILPLVFLGFYHDYHVHHPVDSNRKYINMVMRVRNFGFGMNKS